MVIGYFYGLLCSIIGAYEDLKKREIDDFLWLSMLWIGLVIHFNIIEFLGVILISLSLKYEKLFYVAIILFLISFFYFNSLYAIAFVVFYIFSILLYYSNLMGGGDCKFLMGLSYLNGALFTITSLLNGILFIIPYSLFLLLQNIKEKNYKNLKFKNVLLLFIATKKEIKDVKKFEMILGDDNNISYLPKLNKDYYCHDNNKTYNNMDSNKNQCCGKIWITPKLPFLVFILFSYILYGFYNKIIIFEIMNWFFY